MQISQIIKDQMQAVPRVAYTIPETAKALNIGRTMVYELIQAGRLKSIHLGTRHLVPTSEVEAFINRLQAGE